MNDNKVTTFDINFITFKFISDVNVNANRTDIGSSIGSVRHNCATKRVNIVTFVCKINFARAQMYLDTGDYFHVVTVLKLLSNCPNTLFVPHLLSNLTLIAGIKDFAFSVKFNGNIAGVNMVILNFLRQQIEKLLIF